MAPPDRSRKQWIRLQDADAELQPVDVLAEDFAQRWRAGEQPSIDDYLEHYPEVAEEIRAIFPSIALIEKAKESSRNARERPGACADLPPPPQRLGEYRIVREIGRGGMGVVYEAEQESLARRVALKALPASPRTTATQIERFRREAQAAARLHHTNIVPVFGVGEQDGVCYYVMQYVDGRGLDKILGELTRRVAEESTVAFQSPPTPEEPLYFPREPEDARLRSPGFGTHAYWQRVATIGRQVAEALAHAHLLGTVHRDIKPSNLLLDAGGAVWVTDFGLAKLAEHDDLTQAGDVIGTLRYMAPEQFKGAPSARSDVYSLGATLYELATLRPVHDATERAQLVHQVLNEEPRRPRALNPRIPADLETIIQKAIARDVDRRYGTAGELAEDLGRFLEGLPVRARKMSSAARLWRWSRRNPVAAGLSLAVLASLGAAAAVGWLGYVREAAQRTQTRTERERAEDNLALALDAFEGVFRQIAGAEGAGAWEEEAVFQPYVSGDTAAVMQNLTGFYGRFAARNRDNPRLQVEMPNAYRRMGEIRSRLGEFAQAEEAFAAALELYERMGKEPALAAASKKACADIRRESGYALRMIGRQREAGEECRRALALLNELAAAAPDDAAIKLATAKTYFLLGSLPGREPDRAPPPDADRPPPPDDDRRPPPETDRPPPPDADRPPPNRDRPPPPEFDRPPPGAEDAGAEGPEENTRKALVILEELQAGNGGAPECRRLLALTYRALAELLERTRARAEADAAALKAVQILVQLAEEFPLVSAYRYDLVMAYTGEPRYGARLAGRGRVFASYGSDDMARALQLAQELAASRSTVPAYRFALGRCHLKLGERLLDGDRRSEAEESLRRALALLDGLRREHPSISAYRCDYLLALQLLADVQRRSGNTAEAARTLQENVASIEDALKEGPQRQVEWLLLAAQYEELANALAELGRAAEADTARARAATIRRDQGPQ